MYQDKQPQAVPQMAVGGGGNRNAKNIPFKPSGKREWSHGLCSCFDDCGTCCLAYFCPCIVYSKVKHRIEYLNANGRPDPNQGGSGCDGDCMVHGCITYFLGLGCILQIGNRSTIRTRYSIDGSALTDCCTACWCTPCELTQESRELELEERSFTGA